VNCFFYLTYIYTGFINRSQEYFENKIEDISWQIKLAELEIDDSNKVLSLDIYLRLQGVCKQATFTLLKPYKVLASILKLTTRKLIQYRFGALFSMQNR
jgi:hypothetical protein